VPPRYAFRLEDLRVFHLVRASCHACGYKANKLSSLLPWAWKASQANAVVNI
jgi:ribosomal protein L37E